MSIETVSDVAFLPHGYCILWQPVLLWLHVLSDLLIAIAYFSIPIMLVMLLRRRAQGLPYPWVFGMFSIFILFCGLTHVVQIITLWYPLYYLEGVMKALTAAASLATALMLIPLIPILFDLIGDKTAIKPGAPVVGSKSISPEPDASNERE